MATSKRGELAVLIAGIGVPAVFIVVVALLHVTGSALPVPFGWWYFWPSLFLTSIALMFVAVSGRWR